MNKKVYLELVKFCFSNSLSMKMNPILLNRWNLIKNISIRKENRLQDEIKKTKPDKIMWNID